MVEISSGKQSLRLATPVIGASGIFGFAGEFSKLVSLDKLGAIVTNAVTARPRRAATGTRVVAVDSGILIHTGLPNPGIRRVYQQYAAKWKNSNTPIIVHIAATAPDDVATCVAVLEQGEGVSVAAIEIGLSDLSTHRDAKLMISAAREHTSLPLLAQLPLYEVPHTAGAAVDAGADALVISSPPRGTARDPMTGQLVGGRLYGPWLKAFGLRAVGQIAGKVKIPIIGCGGIHNPHDARDFLEAGASAVQVDTVAWIRPEMVDIIARDLGGLELTRPGGALADEWWPGLGETAVQRAQLLSSPPPIVPPKDLPK